MRNIRFTLISSADQEIIALMGAKMLRSAVAAHEHYTLLSVFCFKGLGHKKERKDHAHNKVDTQIYTYVCLYRRLTAAGLLKNNSLHLGLFFEFVFRLLLRLSMLARCELTLTVSYSGHHCYGMRLRSVITRLIYLFAQAPMQSHVLPSKALLTEHLFLLFIQYCVSALIAILSAL